MNKQDDKKRVTPKLRFPEFQAMLGWDTFKLNDVSTRILDKVGDKKLMPISITAGVGIVSQEEKFGKNISGKQYKNYIKEILSITKETQKNILKELYII